MKDNNSDYDSLSSTTMTITCDDAPPSNPLGVSSHGAPPKPSPRLKRKARKGENDFDLYLILCTTVNVFTTTLPFYATQIISPFLTSKISQSR